MLDYHPMKRLNGTRRDYDRMVTTICQECAVGCGICAYVSEGRIVDVQGDERHPVSNGRLCGRGMAFARELNSPERIASLMHRKSLQDDFEALDTWEQALDLLSDSLKKIRDQHGPRSLFIDCDPSAGLDFYYGAKRFAALWGTPHVLSPLDDPENSSSAVPNTPDIGCSEWIHSRCLFIVAADLASTHPVAFRWVLEAQKNGAKIVVADSRFTKTMSKADVALRIGPDAGNSLGMGLMKAILDKDLGEPNSLPPGLDVPESWWNSFEKISLETVVKSTGLSLSKLEEAAILLAKRGPAQLITGKRLAYLPHYEIWRIMATVMGGTVRRGGGWYPLDSGRPPLSALANLTLETQPESGATSEVSHKAVICSGDFDISSSLCTRQDEAPVFTAYFGALATETPNRSHMVFPAQTWAEQEGLFFTNDKAIQWGRKIVEPPDPAKSGLYFWTGLAKRFGWQDHFPWMSYDDNADQEAFFDWLLAQNEVTKGSTVEVLKKASDDGTSIYWLFGHDSEPRKSFEKIALLPAHTSQQPSDESNELYPLYLEIADAISRRIIRLQNEMLGTGDLMQINPETARALGIETGDEVVLKDSEQCVDTRAWVTRMVPRRLVYLPNLSRGKNVLVYKKGQSGQEALSILRKLFS